MKRSVQQQRCTERERQNPDVLALSVSFLSESYVRCRWVDPPARDAAAPLIDHTAGKDRSPEVICISLFGFISWDVGGGGVLIDWLTPMIDLIDWSGGIGSAPDETGAAHRRRPEAKGGPAAAAAAAAGLGRGREHHQQRAEETERHLPERAEAALHPGARWLVIRVKVLL